jgi:hypothetical protein
MKKQEIFKAAHRLAKSMNNDVDYSARLSVALRTAWANARLGDRSHSIQEFKEILLTNPHYSTFMPTESWVDAAGSFIVRNDLSNQYKFQLSLIDWYQDKGRLSEKQAYYLAKFLHENEKEISLYN